MMTRQYTLGSLILVSLAVTAVHAQQAKERTYKGQPLSTWIKQLHDPKGNQDEAAAALLVFVPESRAAVVEALAAAVKREPCRLAVLEALYWIGPCGTEAVPALASVLRESKEWAYRSKAAEVLGEIGPAAKDAVPELIAALDPKEIFVYANSCAALVKVGKSAVPALITALNGKDTMRRRVVAEALGKIGADADAAVPSLIAALRDKDYGLQVEATIALGRIGPAAKAAAPLLFELYKTRNDDLRRYAIEALANIGPEEKVVVPYFRERFRSYREKGVMGSSEVFPVLEKLGPAALPVWLEVLQIPHQDMLRPALQALATMGPAARDAVPTMLDMLVRAPNPPEYDFEAAIKKIGAEAVPALVAALKDNDKRRRKNAASALASLGPNAKEALGPLTEALRDPNRDVRYSAAYALANMRQEAKPALAVLLERVQAEGEHAGVRWMAALALGWLGAEAKQALPALFQMHKDWKYEHRARVALVLARVAPADEGVQRTLIAALQDEDKQVRRYAAEALGEIGAAAKPAVPALIEALDALLKSRQDLDYAEYYCEALGKMKPEAKDAIPVLIACLKETGPLGSSDRVKDALAKMGPAAIPVLFDCLEDERIRLRAIDILSRMRPPVAALKDALGDRRAAVRRRAADLLGQQGPVAHSAAPELLAAIKDSDKNVRWVAMEALGNLKTDDPKVVAALREALKEKEHRLTAAASLIKCTADPKVIAEVVAVLHEMLQSKSFLSRSSAADLMGRIGPPAVDAIPALLECYSLGNTVNSEVPMEDLDFRPADVRRRLAEASKTALLKILR